MCSPDNFGWYRTLVDFWGCEFLDDGTFGSVFEPGPSYPDSVRLLPIEMVRLFVDKKRIPEIKINDDSQIKFLMGSISTIGLQNPLPVVYTPFSIYLADGHHRFVACENLGFKHIPTILSHSNHKSKTGISTTSFLEWIFDGF